MVKTKRSSNRAQHPGKNATQLATSNLYTRAFRVNGGTIPPRVQNPRITKVVRLDLLLTNADPTKQISYQLLSQQDGIDYLGGSTFRYKNMRVDKTRVFLENYPTTSTVPQPNLVVSELRTAYTAEDRPVIGNSYAAIGLQFSLPTRQFITAADDTLDFMSIACNPAPPSGSALRATVDVWCEFS